MGCGYLKSPCRKISPRKIAIEWLRHDVQSLARVEDLLTCLTAEHQVLQRLSGAWAFSSGVLLIRSLRTHSSLQAISIARGQSRSPRFTQKHIGSILQSRVRDLAISSQRDAQQCY